MDQILLCSNHIPLTTAINNSFIRKYMLDANGSYVKVYLYLSMCIQSGERNLSISSLADMMENTEKDILRALRYWEKKDLLHIQRDSSGSTITGIEIVNPDDLERVVPKQIPQEITPETTAGSDSKTDTASLLREENSDYAKPAKSISPDDHSKADTQETSASHSEVPEFAVTQEQTLRLASDETFSWICLIVESYLGQPLKPAEIQLLTYLFDTLKFSKDLILHLYEYCCSLKKTNVKYV